jgi:hypothetical protein
MLDLDHRDPALKNPKFKKKNMGSCWIFLSFKELLDEIAKCDVLCANHHRLRTWEQQHSEDI